MRRPLLCGCVCLFVVLALWMQITNSPPWNVDNTHWEGEEVLLTGQVYRKEYRISYGEEILVLYLKSVLYSTEADASYLQMQQASKKLSEINPIENIICEIYMSDLSEGSFLPALGSNVLVKGSWQGFTHATNPGEFDAGNYYAIEGICAKLSKAGLLGADKKSWPLREKLYQLKQHLTERLYEAFPQKEASLLAKMLLGDGSGLDKEIRELYQSNGIIHILSISGLHITMLGMGLYRGLRRCSCPLGIAAVLGAGFIILYGMMTGFGTSACRAIGMYLIHMLGEIWGKTYDMPTAMGVLAIFMLLDNPLLVYHSGFLLSFASVCGVGLLSPLLQLPKEWFRKKPGERCILQLWKKALQKLSGNFIVSLSVTLFTLPMQLYFFYKIPVYSVLLNLFVIPLMSIVMLVGIAGMLLPGLGFLSTVETGIFSWFEWLCNTFEKLPGHTLLTGRPDMWRILGYYAVLIAVICGGKWLKLHWRAAALAVSAFFLCIPLPGKLEISVLDVGQGDCICVRTADNRCFLFDGGSSSRSNVGEKVILPFLQYYGVDRIDGIFLSHGDTDHYNGIVQLMESGEVKIEKLYLPQAGKQAMQDFSAVLKAAREIPIQYISKGDCLTLGNLTISCLHPTAGYEGDSNACSACYLLEEREFSMLLTGDVEGDGENLLIQELRRCGIRQIDVLKVAHHGSRYSTGEAFLEAIEVENAVISCGRDNAYGHPHKELLKRLDNEACKVWQTAEKGCIFITSEGMIYYKFSDKSTYRGLQN